MQHETENPCQTHEKERMKKKKQKIKKKLDGDGDDDDDIKLVGLFFRLFLL